MALSPPGEEAPELGHGTAGICFSGRLNTALFEKDRVQSSLRTPQGDAVISPLGKMLGEEVSEANAKESCWASGRREAGPCALQQNAFPTLAIGQGPWQRPSQGLLFLERAKAVQFTPRLPPSWGSWLSASREPSATWPWKSCKGLCPCFLEGPLGQVWVQASLLCGCTQAAKKGISPCQAHRQITASP